MHRWDDKHPLIEKRFDGEEHIATNYYCPDGYWYWEIPSLGLKGRTATALGSRFAVNEKLRQKEVRENG